MISKTFDVFGVRGPNLLACAKLVEQATLIRLALHNSAYKGGDYYRATLDGGDLIVRNNFIPFTDTWAEDDFRDFPFLVCTDMPTDPDAVRTTLQEGGGGLIIWLRRRVVEGKKITMTTRRT